MDSNLTFIKNINWQEAFDIWQENELKQEKWKKVYTAMGFASWQQWRQSYIVPLQLEKLDWQLYKIDRPLEIVPNFFGGPFAKWKEYYYKDKNTLSFKELAKAIDVQDLVNNFPATTSLIGLRIDNKIFIIEGMHRCCAISLIKQKKIKFTSDINIALANYSHKSLPIV